LKGSIVDRYVLGIVKRIQESGTARFTDLRNVVGNPRTLSAKLKELRSLCLIEPGGGGYALSTKGLEVAALLSRLKSTIEGQLPEFTNIERIPHEPYRGLIRRYCEILYERYGSDLRSILLMGSVARGDWDKDSDIDLLVVVDSWNHKPIWNRLRELRACTRRLRETPQFERAFKQAMTATIQHYPMSRLEALKFHRVYIDASLDGLILFDRDGFLHGILEKLRQTLARQGAKRIQLPGRTYYWVLKEVKAGEVFTF